MADTLTSTITNLASDVDTTVARLAARERYDELTAASQAVVDLGHAVAAARGRAVRALVEEVGATAAARDLGVSRNRVYTLMAQGDND